MKVLVNGVGNIGTTLACLLFDYKDVLEISEVYVYKNTIQNWKNQDLNFLKEKGVNIILSTDKTLKEVLQNIDYVFETTTNGIGNQNKNIYFDCKNLKGVSAQGSEKGFGIAFMSGINEDKIEFQKFVQIVSCNTHGAASLLQTLSGNKLENLVDSDFVVVRRSEDIGNHERLVGASVVARHLSEINGTHHAIDVKDMFQTIDINCPITSSDITTPSQLMHATRFSITTKENISQTLFNSFISSNPFIAKTKKFDSNLVFELGRRYGKYGRIFNHLILVENNIMFHGNTIKGWAFVPQEGNSIISTIHAFILQTHGKIKSNSKIQIIKKDLLISEF